MSDPVYGQDEKAKLERLVNEGAQVLQEVKIPRRFERNCKAVAEELNVKTGIIHKAIRVAHKGDWHKVDEFEDLKHLGYPR